ncbi:MAG: hypothetical protein Barrevirus13_10 [Barrevirus sp.]|uniref:Uncharacterized protein n=1 Tax=Barrevirus sp. TaxID=2487763 RepID=A0A3G4ZSZ4_9VIRU|nr:MAG: hypothetical protein Barrevirus13_10 [Barrevirus sp.]
MGISWSDIYLVLDGTKHVNKDDTYYTLPELTGKSVIGVFKILNAWFDDYLIISTVVNSVNPGPNNVLVLDNDKKKHKVIIIKYKPTDNIVSQVEVYP